MLRFDCTKLICIKALRQQTLTTLCSISSRFERGHITSAGWIWRARHVRMVLAIATSDVRYFTAALRSFPRSVCDTRWREGARGRERKYEVNFIITIRRNKSTAFVGHLKVLYDVAQLSSTHFSAVSVPQCSGRPGVPRKAPPLTSRVKVQRLHKDAEDSNVVF